MIRILISTYLLLFGWGVLIPSFVYAQSPELEVAKDAVYKSVKNLEDNPLDQVQSAGDNIFQLKKQVVLNVLDFSELELADLLKKHRAISLKNNGGLIDIYNAFSLHLNQAKDSLSEYRDRIEDEDLDLEQLQKLATDLKTWRIEQYDPINKIFFDFLLVAKIENSILISDSRGNKIERDLSRLKREVGEETLLNLQTFFAKAQLEIALAKEDQGQAKILFRKMVTPLLLAEKVSTNEEIEIPEADAKLAGDEVSESTAKQEEVNTPEDETSLKSDSLDYEMGKNELNRFLSQALDHIREAYLRFIEMSKLANSKVEAD